MSEHTRSLYPAASFLPFLSPSSTPSLCLSRSVFLESSNRTAPGIRQSSTVFRKDSVETLGGLASPNATRGYFFSLAGIYGIKTTEQIFFSFFREPYPPILSSITRIRFESNGSEIDCVQFRSVFPPIWIDAADDNNDVSLLLLKLSVVACCRSCCSNRWLLVAVSTGKLHTRRVLSRIGLASSLFFNGSSACCLFNNVLDHARPVDAAVCYGMSTPMLVWVGVKDWQGGDEKASLLVDSEAGLLRHGLPLIFQCWYTRQYDVLDWFSGGGSCWIARIRCFSPYSITRQRAGISPSLRKRIRNRPNEHRLASWPVLDPPSRKNLLPSALSRSPRQIRIAPKREYISNSCTCKPRWNSQPLSHDIIRN